MKVASVKKLALSTKETDLRVVESTETIVESNVHPGDLFVQNPYNRNSWIHIPKAILQDTNEKVKALA